jgi:RNA polymerase sigma-70 factor (ECF subfamily)
VPGLKNLVKRFEKIALPHLNAVYRAAVALCGNPNKADDLVQTTYLKALQKFSSFKTGTNCRAWLLTILRNHWIDELRHKKCDLNSVHFDETIAEKEPSEAQEALWTNADDLLENFSDEQIIKALGRLSDEQRLTLFLIDVEQYSQEDVAQITDVALGTVKSRTSRARAVLRRELKNYSEEMGYLRGEK